MAYEELSQLRREAGAEEMDRVLWFTAEPHGVQHAQQRILAKILRHKMTALVPGTEGQW